MLNALDYQPRKATNRVKDRDSSGSEDLVPLLILSGWGKDSAFVKAVKDLLAVASW